MTWFSCYSLLFHLSSLLSFLLFLLSLPAKLMLSISSSLYDAAPLMPNDCRHVCAPRYDTPSICPSVSLSPLFSVATDVTAVSH